MNSHTRFSKEALEQLFFGRMTSIKRKKVHEDYLKEGFDVDTGGNLKRMPYIDVKATEAKVDKDFYDKGDE